MIDAGAVHLRLTLSDTPRRIETAAAACRRPMAARVLGSKRREEVLTLVPRLFAVCGQAQGLAAKLALAAARGEATAVHRDPTVAQEGVREHLWHFFSQEKPLLAAGLAALKTSPEALQTFLDGHLGLPAADWLGFSQAAELDAWATAGDGLLQRSFRQTLKEPPVAPVPLLPAMDAVASLEHWPLLDVDHYVSGLLNHVFGTSRWMAELGRRGGSVSSTAKAAAARINGKKGGRPRHRAA